MFEILSSITVAGLSVRECGPATAPTVCFLHGGGVSGWMWRSQVESLQDTYHCLIPDMPEHGQSATIQPFTIADTAHRIAELMRQRAHGGRAHVIGLSEGAQVAVQLLGTAAEVGGSRYYQQCLAAPASWYGPPGPSYTCAHLYPLYCSFSKH